MIDVSWGHLVVIAVVALIVIGPKELPTVLRTVGHWTGKIRRMAAEFQGQFQEALREAEVADLKQHFDDISSAAKDLPHFDPVGTIRKEIEGAAQAKAGSEPPPGLSQPPAPAGAAAAPSAEPTTPEPTTPEAAAAGEANAAPPQVPEARASSIEGRVE